MNVLYLGNVNDIFLLKLIENIQNNINDYDFSIFSLVESNVNKSKFDLFTINKNKLVYKIPKIRMIYNISEIKKNIGYILNKKKYDLIHILGVNPYFFVAKKELNKENIISTIYGSEFYKSTKISKYLQKNIFDISKNVTFSNEKTSQDFCKYYGKYYEKVKICRFGLSALDIISGTKISAEKIRNKMNLPLNSIIIAVGTNGYESQNHEIIIESINNIKKNISKNIFLLLQMTYGTNNKYKEKIKDTLMKSDIKYRIYDKFLSEIDNALIKMSVDIAIQIQENDQFSGTMQEYLYAGALVITGSWLPYEKLEKSGVFFLKINNKYELENTILNAIIHNDIYCEQCKKNKKEIWNLSSWKKNISSWVELYNNAVK